MRSDGPGSSMIYIACPRKLPWSMTGWGRSPWVRKEQEYRAAAPETISKCKVIRSIDKQVYEAESFGGQENVPALAPMHTCTLDGPVVRACCSKQQ